MNQGGQTLINADKLHKQNTRERKFLKQIKALLDRKTRIPIQETMKPAKPKRYSETRRLPITSMQQKESRLGISQSRQSD